MNLDCLIANLQCDLTFDIDTTVQNKNTVVPVLMSGPILNTPAPNHITRYITPLHY